MTNRQLAIQFLGNVDACRTEAEVFWSSAAPGEDPTVARVYESREGFKTEYLDASPGGAETPGLAAAIADAQAGLLQYVNRRGENPPVGLSRAALSLWLLEKDDGTALGLPSKERLKN